VVLRRDQVPIRIFGIAVVLTILDDAFECKSYEWKYNKVQKWVTISFRNFPECVLTPYLDM
jgi:hypothetical protein